MSFIVGDFGGTNARLAVADGHRLTHVWSRPCTDFADPDEALGAFLDETGARPRGAVLAVTGPLARGEANFANNGWRFSEARLSELLGPTRLVNDFEALAMALPVLPKGSLLSIGPLSEGEAGGPMCVLGPGTGLGVGCALPRPDGDVAVSGEGGHSGFAPVDETELELARILMRREPRLHLETILSGPGLARLHLALAEVEGRTVAPLHQTEVAAGASGGDADCRRTVGRFLAILASAAGDFALTYGARGGVFLAGGVTLNLAPLLDADAFRARFEAKGTRAGVLRAIPTFLINDPMAALIGAARLAPG